MPSSRGLKLGTTQGVVIAALAKSARLSLKGGITSKQRKPQKSKTKTPQTSRQLLNTAYPPGPGASHLWTKQLMYAARVRCLVHRQAPWISLHLSTPRPQATANPPAPIWWKITPRSRTSKLSVETGQVQYDLTAAFPEVAALVRHAEFNPKSFMHKIIQRAVSSPSAT